MSGIIFHNVNSLDGDCDEALFNVVHRRPGCIVANAVLHKLPYLIWHVQRLGQVGQAHSDPGQSLRAVFEVGEGLLLGIKLRKMVSKFPSS